MALADVLRGSRNKAFILSRSRLNLLCLDGATSTHLIHLHHAAQLWNRELWHALDHCARQTLEHLVVEKRASHVATSVPLSGRGIHGLSQIRRLRAAAETSRCGLSLSLSPYDRPTCTRAVISAGVKEGSSSMMCSEISPSRKGSAGQMADIVVTCHHMWNGRRSRRGSKRPASQAHVHTSILLLPRPVWTPTSSGRSS